MIDTVVRTVVVTGAAGGIGSALVGAFRQAGYRTIGVDRAPAAGVEALDVTDTAAVTSWAGRAGTGCTA